MDACLCVVFKGGGKGARCRSFFVMSTPTSGDRNVPSHEQVHLKRSTWQGLARPVLKKAMSPEFGRCRADIQPAVPAARLVPSDG